MLDVARGVEFLHSESIIHMDIKPDNILVTSNGIAKLVDFGVSEEVPMSNRTLSCAGTAPYNAPEKLRRLPNNHSGDVFSCALVFWIMLQWRDLRTLPWLERTRGQLPTEAQIYKALVDRKER